MMQFINRVWYQNPQHPLSYALLPLSWLYAAILRIRRVLYQNRFIQSYRAPVPVIVIGNITVGGTGKTPMIIALAALCKTNGLRVGIVSRGYGGQCQTATRVFPQSNPEVCGDEPVYIAQATQCPVVVATSRIQAVQCLLDSEPCDIILADDGLSHYRLMRDIDIVMVDGMRLFGNGCYLPAGPLRDSKRKLYSADFIVYKQHQQKTRPFYLTLQPIYFRQLGTAQIQSLHAFKGKMVHAVAAIANPANFFLSLKQLGLIVREHPLADHARLNQHDIMFEDDLAVIVTEKDAVKCEQWQMRNTWVLHTKPNLNEHFQSVFNAKLRGLMHAKSTT